MSASNQHIAMPSLCDLAPHDDEGNLRVVVETPRNSTLKLAFDPACDGFVVKRELMLGLSFPYDFGFIPGTRADDGDPLDAMVLHSSCSYPGAILPCRALGFVAVRQHDDGHWIENHRVIAAPAWDGHTVRAENISDLPKDTLRELEQFFVNTAYFTGKKLKLKGWRPARQVARLVAASKR